MKESSEKRSEIMRAVKAKDTAPELSVRKLIFQLGYRYRIHSNILPGKPDVYFPKKKKAIFIHGCFWHGHPCKRGNRIPARNQIYWREKIERNKARDSKNINLLANAGWSVLVIWECDLKDADTLKQELQAFLDK